MGEESIVEITVSVAETEQSITLPAGIDVNIHQVSMDTRAKFGVINQIIGNYRLRKCLNVSQNSEIWLSSDQFNSSVVVKISKNKINPEIYDRIRGLRCENLIPILEFGVVGEYRYEVMPYYRNGSLQGKIDETIIKDLILPSLINALKILHENRLIHNDIKPENLLWNDEKNTVLLGDYGCITESGGVPQGYSLSYAAPEVLLGNPSEISSDWVSVGLTLGTLISGTKIVKAQSKANAIRWWEKSYVFCEGSSTINQLINGMIQRDAKRRLGPKAASAWINNSAFGAERRVRQRAKPSDRKQMLVFENPHFVVEDIEGMLLAAEHYWEHFVFLLGCGKIEAFLKSLNEDAYHYLLTLKRDYGFEEIVCILTYYLSNNQYFIWKGIRYIELGDLEQTWDYQPDVIKEFLLKGLVSHILKTDGASQEQLDYVEELVNIGRLDPEKACQLLFIALRGEETFTWKGIDYNTIGQLIDDICSVPEEIDETVKNLLSSSRFQAWMTFLGFGDFVEKILKRCR